jgi:hypothetical protein
MPLARDSRRPRGLGLVDGMILIASTALSLGWLRHPLEYRLSFYADGRIIENLRPSTIVGAGFAATWSLGVLAIRLRPPRPIGEEWKRSPGFVACLAATSACLIKMAALFIWGAFVKFKFETWYVPSILGQLIEPAAMGVVGAWLALGLAGTWARERSWIDNLGIGVGTSWIALEVFAWAALCLENLS